MSEQTIDLGMGESIAVEKIDDYYYFSMTTNDQTLEVTLTEDELSEVAKMLMELEMT